MEAGAGVPGELEVVLERARHCGFVGPGPVVEHLRLALAMAEAVITVPGQVLDLGAGGGVPGLILAGVWPHSRWLLLDSSARRTSFLAGAVAQLGLADRVEVVRARAEEAGRRPEWRGQQDLVVARSFGPPPVTAECAAPFLRPGGLLVASEPPSPVPGRWPEAGLARLGLEVVRRSRPGPEAGSWIALAQVELCPDRYPRRVGLPKKHPLFPVVRGNQA